MRASLTWTRELDDRISDLDRRISRLTSEDDS
jgi:hypothetical protein